MNATKDVYDNLRKATIEVNLTSNEFLVADQSGGYDGAGHILRTLLQNGFDVVLGTDDPGIFPGTTLRSEFLKAARRQLVRSADELIGCARRGLSKSFASPATRARVAAFLPDADWARGVS